MCAPSFFLLLVFSLLRNGHWTPTAHRKSQDPPTPQEVNKAMRSSPQLHVQEKNIIKFTKQRSASSPVMSASHPLSKVRCQGTAAAVVVPAVLSAASRCVVLLLVSLLLLVFVHQQSTHLHNKQKGERKMKKNGRRRTQQ